MRVPLSLIFTAALAGPAFGQAAVEPARPPAPAVTAAASAPTLLSDKGEGTQACDQLDASAAGRQDEVFDGRARRRDGPFEVVEEAPNTYLGRGFERERECWHDDIGGYDYGYGHRHGHPHR